MGLLVINSDFEKLWGITEKEYYSKQYLTFEALEDGTFSFYYPDDINSAGIITSISYSLDDGKTWITEEFTQGEEKEVKTPEIKAGKTVLWKGDGSPYDMGNDDYCSFGSDGKFNVSGNIMSLIYGDDFYGKNFDANREDSFDSMFSDTDIVSAEWLILPNNVVNANYGNMFAGCHLLTAAPVLPAITLTTGCYYSMFSGCTSLDYIKMLATDISAVNCLYSWTQNVAATGTLVISNDYDGNRRSLNIPDGWTVLNEDGTEHVFPARDYSQEYFTIEAVEDSEVDFIIPIDLTGGQVEEIYYKLNDDDWEPFDGVIDGGDDFECHLQLEAGDILQFKGIAQRYAGILMTDSQDDSPEEFYSNITIAGGGDVKVYGNIYSLFYSGNFYESYYGRDGFPEEFACAGLFATNDEAPKIDCSNLILGEDVTNGCFYNMFADCTGVIIPPELPATTLAKWCYNGMFAGCSSLTTAPDLPNATIAMDCYDSMFYGCRSLNYIKAMFNPSGDVTSDWVKNVAASGIFVKNSNVNWTTGNNGIPSGWTVQTADA